MITAWHVDILGLNLTMNKVSGHFSLKYTNFVLREIFIFPNDLHSLSILDKKITFFLA